MLHSITHKSCHFEEACAFELPSRASISCQSLLRPSSEFELKTTNGRSTKEADPIISPWGGGASTTTQFRFSTEHHALTVAVSHKEGNAHMAKSSLPKIVKNGINSKETSCISHSFLPMDEISRNRNADNLSSNGIKSSYIEGFLMCTNSPDGDGNIDVAKSAHTYATSASFSSDLRKDLTPSSSYGTLAPLDESSIKKRDDVASTSVSFFDRSIGAVKDEYFLVVKGYLPDLDDSVTAVKDRSVDDAAAEKSDAPRGDTMSNSSEKKKSDDHFFSNTSKRKKGSKCDDICTNFNQVFPLSYQPSLIEMSQGDDLSEFIICVADDTKVKIYSLFLTSLSESELARNNKFDLKECILAREDERQEGVEQNQNRAFMAMLIQESHDSESNVLSFPSPITALCHTVKGSMHYLSVASQNGTVRIISFTAHEGKHQQSGFRQDNYGGIPTTSQVESNRYFAVKAISEFTIDGPVLCLAYSKHNQHGDNDCPKVLCGSMCGFACYFCPSSGTKSGFDGPISITEGLWNQNLCEEDSVMSICEFSYGGAHEGSLICLGLFSGRVVCYTPCSRGKGELLNELALDPSMHQRLGLDSLNSLPNFHPVWSYSLSLPIHSIGVANSGLFSDIVVCTGRTLHIFHSTTERIAEGTLERLDALLYKYSNGNYSDDRVRSNNSESKIQSIVSL